MKCRGSDCDREAVEGERYCAEDLVPVLSVQVRKVDYPQRVAESEEDLAEGEWFGFEQCDNCGNSDYVAVQHGGHWYMRCTLDPNGEYAREMDDPAGVGCGAEYPVTWSPTAEVA